MTLAARLALEKQQQQLNAGKTSNAANGGISEVWMGLDSLGGLGGRNEKPEKNDWGLGDLGRGSKPSGVTRPTTEVALPTTQQATKTLWDLDGFASPSPSLTPPPPHTIAPQPSRSSSLSTAKHKPNDSSSIGRNKNKEVNDARTTFDTPDDDFDFGGTEDRGLLDLDLNDDVDCREQRNGKGNRTPEDDDDDILGMLSKPVEVVRASTRKKVCSFHVPFSNCSHYYITVTQTPPLAPSFQTPTQTPAQPPPSPPPHILGQIVEMGFSVAQARKALSTTKDGMDVQAALESLLNGGSAGSGNEERERESRPPPPQRRVPPPAHDEPPPTTQRAAPKGYKERERERMRMQRGENSTDDPVSITEIQLQADKLVSQASEIGLSVFSKATAFWKEGKGKVVRAYEERAAGVGAGVDVGESGRGMGRGDGRPKWMMKDVTMEDEEVDKFSDGVGDVRENSVHVLSTAVVDDEVDLFSSSSVPNSKPTSTPLTRTTTRTQTHTRILTRNLPTTTATTLSTAHTHKTTGTQAFKLGQYAAASDAYGLAISILPPHHLLLLPLYTNRALAWLKTGEYASAAEDCSLALSIITAGELSWTPASESEDPRMLDRGKANEGGWTHPQGLGVDLCDQYVKALKRRALALEGREKWGDAGRDWEILAGMRVELVGENTRGEAVMGAGRCRRMCGGDTSGSATPAVKPRPKPKAKPTPTFSNSSTSTPAPSAALTALQTQTAQAEADLTLQYTLKDTIDARLSAWRKGKESNIRALLASLDAVLWAEVLHGVKVGGGMAELVSPAQVKKAYMRAIGRVHPDKVGLFLLFYSPRVSVNVNAAQCVKFDG